MGRRKKAPRSAHREAIAAAASVLFLEKGVPAATMDDIARAAGYSKATLYAYFESKEEIVSLLVLESFRRLCGCIAAAMEEGMTTREKYDLICRELLRYQEAYPLYFRMTLEAVDVDFENRTVLPEERETWRAGEELNRMIDGLLRSGMERGELRRDLDTAPAAFSAWGMLGGLIQFADSKAAYIRQSMGLSKREFLQYGFDMIYRSLEAGEGERGCVL